MAEPGEDRDDATLGLKIRPVTFIGGPSGNTVTQLPLGDPRASPHMCSEEAGGFHHWWRRGDGTGDDLVYTYAGPCNETNAPHSWHDHEPMYVADVYRAESGMPRSTFEKVGYFALRLGVAICLFYVLTLMPGPAGVAGTVLLFAFVLGATFWAARETRALRPKPCLVCHRDDVEVLPLPARQMPAPRAWWDLRFPRRLHLAWVCQDDLVDYLRARVSEGNAP